MKEGEIMDAMKAIAQKNSLRTERDTWKRTAVCLLAAAVLPNAALWRAAGDIRQLRLEVQQAELDRNAAVRRLNALAEDIDKEQQARAAQAMAYETVSGYQYIGECVITAYCPCAECCGQWADGLTATGIPASGGIVAVDPAVIPLGSTVIIGGLEYLAADTGVDGMHIDICTDSHQEAAAFGVQTAGVRVIDTTE